MAGPGFDQRNLQQPVATPFGTGPEDLAKPAVDAEAEAAGAAADAVDEFDDVMIAQPAGEGEFDDLMIAPQALPPVEGEAFIDQEERIEPGGAEGFEELTENIVARFVRSFGVTKKEKGEATASVLTKSGKEVKFIGKELVFKAPGEKKFRKVDPEIFDEFVSDIAGDAVDFSREAVEEGVALPFEIAGSALGGPIGLGLGRAIGIGTGIATADFIAETALGIERDPERSKAREIGTAATLNVLLPVIGTRVARMAKNRVDAFRNFMPEHQLLRKESKQFEQDAAQLAAPGPAGEPGLISNIPDTDTPFMAHQLHPSNPRFEGSAKQLASEDSPQGKVFNKALNEQSDAYEETLDRLLTASGKFNRKGGESDELLQSKIVSIFKTNKKRDGVGIGKARLQAEKNAGPNTGLAIDREVDQSIRGVMETMGFQSVASPTGKAAKLIPPDPADVMLTMGISNREAAVKLIERVTELGKFADSGQMTMGQMIKSVDDIAELIPVANRARGKIIADVNGLSSNLRVQRNQNVERHLKLPEEKIAFANEMEEIQNIFAAEASMANALKGEFTQEAIVKKFLADGNIGNLRKLKKLLGTRHPETYDDLITTWVNKLVSDNTSSSGRIRTNLAGLEKSLTTKKGRQFVNELFEGTATKPDDLFRLIRYGKRLQATDFTKLSVAQKNDMLTEGAQVAMGFRPAIARAFFSLGGIGTNPDDALLKHMSANGIEESLQRIPKPKREQARKFLNSVMAWGKQNELVSTTAKVVEKAAIQLPGAATRAKLREGRTPKKIRTPGLQQ